MKYRADKPCPEPGKMVVVRTSEGDFWRRERGKGSKDAVLNDACEEQKELLKILSPVAAKLVRELRPQLQGLKTERINNRVKSCLRHSLLQTGGIDYRYLGMLDFQPKYPFGNVLQVEPKLYTGGKFMEMKVELPGSGAVRRQSSSVSSYRFVLILVAGDPFSIEPLESFEAASGMYEMGKAYPEGCTLKLLSPPPGKPWAAFLRVISYEGAEPAFHPRHSGMRVIGWSS